MKWSHIDKAPFQKGYTAGLEGRSYDNCRYTLIRKRQAWFAGYRKGKEKREENEAKKANYLRSQEQIQRCSKELSNLRALVNGEKLA